MNELAAKLRDADVVMAEGRLNNLVVHSPLGTTSARGSIDFDLIVSMDGRDAIVRFGQHVSMWLQMKNGRIVAGATHYREHEQYYLDALKVVTGVLRGDPGFVCGTTEVELRPASDLARGSCEFAWTAQGPEFLLLAPPGQPERVLMGRFEICATGDAAGQTQCERGAPGVELGRIWVDPWLEEGFWRVRGTGNPQFHVGSVLRTWDIQAGLGNAPPRLAARP